MGLFNPFAFILFAELGERSKTERGRGGEGWAGLAGVNYARGIT